MNDTCPNKPPLLCWPNAGAEEELPKAGKTEKKLKRSKEETALHLHSLQRSLNTLLLSPKNNKIILFNLPDGWAKLKLDDEDVVVLLPKTEPCPNPELCPNDVDVLDPNKPVPVLLGVPAVPVPNEKDESALLAVEAPKRPAVVVLLVLAPNADWLKEKPLAVPALPLLLLTLPKLLD